MSFLLNLVPCCGVTPGRYELANVPTDEETTSLVQVPGSDKKKSCRPREVAGKSIVTPLQWRPSLCTISEDDVVKEDVTRYSGGKLVKTVSSKPKVGASRNKIELRLEDTSASNPVVHATTFLL